jgi:hypothetical protein
VWAEIERVSHEGFAGLSAAGPHVASLVAVDGGAMSTPEDLSRKPGLVSVFATIACAACTVWIWQQKDAAWGLWQESSRLVGTTRMPFSFTFASIALGALCVLCAIAVMLSVLSTLVAYIGAPDASKRSILHLQARTLWTLTAVCVITGVAGRASLFVGQRQAEEGGLLVSAFHDINAMPKFEIQTLLSDITGGRTTRSAGDTELTADVKIQYTHLPWSRRGEIEQFLGRSLQRPWDIPAERDVLSH